MSEAADTAAVSDSASLSSANQGGVPMTASVSSSRSKLSAEEVGRMRRDDRERRRELVKKKHRTYG